MDTKPHPDEPQAEARSAGRGLLEAIGTNLDPDAVAIVLGRMPARVPSHPDPAAAPLPDHEQSLLIQHSGLNDTEQADLAEVLADPAQVAAHAAAYSARSLANLLDSTHTTAELAQLLDKNPTSITRAANTGRLYAVRVGRTLRFPAWQILDGAPLPGLEKVVTAIPPGIHPASVDSLMTTPQQELDGHTGVQWLASGGDPTPVARLVDELDRW